MPNTTAVRTAQVGAAPFFAGKNKIINGDFRVNQRNFTSTTTSLTYGFDRWKFNAAGSFTPTYSAQTFTPGTAPVAGYEGTNFARMATTANSGAGDYCIFAQLMEDVRTCAGETVTVSFWAKAASGTPKVGVELAQNFGSGGSLQVNGTGQAVTISTSWARYSVTIAVPSISGKTIGTSSYIELNLWTVSGSTYATRSGSVGNQTATIDFWGVQVESGSVATAFQTATGTLQGELAACQRYYFRIANTDAYAVYGLGIAESTTALGAALQMPVPMRVKPTSVDVSNVQFSDTSNSPVPTALSISSFKSSSFIVYLTGSGLSGLTQYRVYELRNNNSTSGYIGLSAEL